MRKNPGKKQLRGLSWLLIVVIFLCGCRETIVHDLDEFQANKVAVALSRVGIDAEKYRDGSLWSVRVPTDSATKALAALDESRILRREPGNSGRRTKNLIQSREEREFFLERELEANLGDTLESLPGVLEAHVHLFVEPDDPATTGLTKRKQSASVLVLNESRDPLEIGEIKKLIAGASGIESAEITVLVSALDNRDLSQGRMVTSRKKEFSKGGQSRMRGSQLRLRKLYPIFLVAGALGLIVFLIARIRGARASRSARSDAEKTLLTPRSVPVRAPEVRVQSNGALKFPTNGLHRPDAEEVF